MLKKVLKAFGAYWLVSWSLYGVSEQLKKGTEIGVSVVKAQRSGEKPPKYKVVSVWLLTFENLKEAVNLFTEYIKESIKVKES